MVQCGIFRNVLKSFWKRRQGEILKVFKRKLEIDVRVHSYIEDALMLSLLICIMSSVLDLSRLFQSKKISLYK